MLASSQTTATPLEGMARHEAAKVAVKKLSANSKLSFTTSKPYSYNRISTSNISNCSCRSNNNRYNLVSSRSSRTPR